MLGGVSETVLRGGGATPMLGGVSETVLRGGGDSDAWGSERDSGHIQSMTAKFILMVNTLVEE